MAILVGFEPTMSPSTGECFEPLSYKTLKLERKPGLEPGSTAWKAGAQPIYHIRAIVRRKSSGPSGLPAILHGP